MKKLVTALGVAAIGTFGFGATQGFAYETDDYGFLIERPRASQARYCPPARTYRAPAQNFFQGIVRTPTAAPAVVRSEVRSSPVIVRRVVTSPSVIVSRTPVEKPTLATAPATQTEAKTSALPTTRNPRR